MPFGKPKSEILIVNPLILQTESNLLLGTSSYSLTHGVKFKEMIIVWTVSIQSKKKNHKHLNIFRNNNSVELDQSDWN